MQTDTVGYKDGLNWYEYVHDDPVNETDASGTSATDGFGIFGGCPAGDHCTSTDPAASNAAAAGNNHAVRNAGAAVGALIGGVVGGGTGGTGGALAGAACGPGAVVCSPAGAAAGATEGAIVGAGIGGVVGGLAGNLIDNVVSMASASGGGDKSPLRFIHSKESMGGNLSSTNFWSKKSTNEIIESLRPGEAESLKVKPDGTVMNGQTRLQVLQGRGVNINSLQREPFP